MVYRIDNSTAGASPPDPGDPGQEGYFTNGDPASAVPATEVEAWWLTMVQEELREVVSHYGLTPDKADNTQVRQAIQAAIAGQGLGTAAYKDWGNGAGQLPEVLTATGQLDPSIIPTTGVDLLRKQILLNSLLDTMSDGGAARLIDMAPDPYADLSRIDTGASSNYTHDAAGAYIHNPGSVTTPSAASEWNGDPENWTFSGDDIYVGHSVQHGLRTNDSFTGDVVLEFDVASWGRELNVGLYSTDGDASFTTTNGDANVGAYAWIIRATQDNAIEVKDHNTVGPSIATNPAGKRARLERTGDTFRFYLDDILEHTFTTTSTAEIRVVLANGNSGAATDLDNVSWTIPGVPGDLTLTSIGLTPTAEPSIGYLLGIVEPVDAVIYGVDLMADITKDNGITWESAGLSKVGTTLDGYDVVYGEVTFTPSGLADVRYRWRAANGKHIKLHGAVPDAE